MTQWLASSYPSQTTRGIGNLAVDDDISNTRCVLVGLFKGSLIRDGLVIKNNEVSSVTTAQ